MPDACASPDVRLSGVLQNEMSVIILLAKALLHSVKALCKAVQMMQVMLVTI